MLVYLATACDRIPSQMSCPRELLVCWRRVSIAGSRNNPTIATIVLAMTGDESDGDNIHNTVAFARNINDEPPLLACDPEGTACATVQAEKADQLPGTIGRKTAFRMEMLEDCSPATTTTRIDEETHGDHVT